MSVVFRGLGSGTLIASPRTLKRQISNLVNNSGSLWFAKLDKMIQSVYIEHKDDVNKLKICFLQSQLCMWSISTLS